MTLNDIFAEVSKKWLPAVPIAFILGSVMFSHSCANTTTPPSGGAKDTIPPYITNINPLPGTVNVTRHKTQIKFTFNEYVAVKDPKSIYLSPPLSKSPRYKMKGKTLVVYFEEDLDSARTYIVDLTNAIADNNEGNMYPGYTLVFSTGDRIDSMMVTGQVQDCNTLQPVKGATVMLYKDQADSAIFLHRPDAACKTDEWGFFCIRNIQDTVYRMYAIMDDNNDNMYQPENERVAFLDTLIRPVTVVNDSLPELAKYDMKDTACCLARKQEFELQLFKEKPTKQMIVNKERVGEKTAYITFMAPYAHIDSLWIKKIDHKKIITQFNLQQDSLEIWVNETKRLPDTLFMNVKYDKTDTLGNLVSTVEEVKLANPRKGKGGKSSLRDIKKEDTTTVFSVDAKSDMVEQYGFVMEFKYPLVESHFDSLKYKIINPKQQESFGKVDVTRDSLNLRKYIIRPKDKMLKGYDYILKVPRHSFKDINGYYNDSLDTKVSLPSEDNLSTLTLKLDGVHNKYIIDLLDEKRTNVLRSFIVTENQDLVFPYIKEGKYSVRITEDLNNNGLVDTGNLLGKKQPEKVKFFKLEDGTFILNIPPMTEMEQDINLDVMFNPAPASKETALGAGNGTEVEVDAEAGPGNGAEVDAEAGSGNGSEVEEKVNKTEEKEGEK